MLAVRNPFPKTNNLQPKKSSETIKEVFRFYWVWPNRLPLSVYNLDVCKVDYTENAKDINLAKVNIQQTKQLQYLNSLSFRTDSEKQEWVWILATMSLSVYISTGSQTQGCQRRRLTLRYDTFNLAVDPIETVMHFSTIPSLKIY